MKYIDIEILFYTEESSHLKELGIKTSDDMHESKSMRFFEIGAIGPHEDKSVVVCHGSEFFCPWSYDQLKMYVCDKSNWKDKS
ncbi:MAG TPA: hypothetical protein VGF79_00895 [Bacteroidia bacterium]